jgi:transposase
MLSQSQRTTILELSAKGKNKREIARLLGLSRQSVRKVLAMNSTAVPRIEREEKAAPHRQRILELLHTCKGNLVRVHEELTADGVTMSYQTLTAFCRRQGIGRAPVVPAGSYDHQCLPGVEMQHDTSPHDVTVDGRKYKAQTASAVLCYSRLLYFEIWPQFQRFDCKAFLTAALRYMDGAPQ